MLQLLLLYCICYIYITYIGQRTMYDVHCTYYWWYTVQYILYPGVRVQCTPYILHTNSMRCSQFVVQCFNYYITPHWLFKSTCILYNVHCTVYIVQCTVYSVLCTVYFAQCSLYSIHCTIYIIQCTLYNVECTV